MTFWDSSALLPIIIEEPRSKACRALHRAHPVVIVWALTRVELVSGLRRLAREGLLAAKDIAPAVRRIDAFERRWTEVTAVEPVRERAERALAVHPLRAADSLQLAAALVACEDRPRRRPFITADALLADAATAEGFDVITPGA